ncbi:SHD1 domain-containing protein [Stratiformator vulcanicus]|uniref:SLA1 homology domain-containing protein n=1 Tax=Stratiformator vulcanicus TaxID=2527980 RepID=A0A517R3Y7_9PLAN|nr:SHD1 domain-containing protein [Stratiformator vulcanicus]QDT38609.1 hypothetical protein Pan189_30040 [Stratiformator vulcanicus]
MSHCFRAFSTSLAFIFVVALATPAAAGEFDQQRTWKDATGRFDLEGKFVKLVDQTVTLEQPSGKEFEVKLSQLSAADRDFAERAAKAMVENPFAPVDDSGNSNDSSGGSSNDLKYVQFDLQEVPELNTDPIETRWSLEPDPQPRVTVRGGRPITTPPRRDAFEKHQATLISSKSATLLLGYTHDGFADRVSKSTRLEICDLKEGRMTRSLVEDSECVPLAIDETGHKILVRSEGRGFGNAARLEQWDISGSKISREFISEPYQQELFTRRDIEWGAYGAGDTFLTIGKANELIIWDGIKFSPLARLPSVDSDAIAVSPGGRYLVVAPKKHLLVIDLERRVTVASIPKVEIGNSRLTFSPSGERLVAAGVRDVHIWDFRTGDLVASIDPDDHSTRGLLMLDNRYLMIKDSIVYDTESRIALWNYSGSKEAVFTVGGLTWFVIKDYRSKTEVIYGGKLPHPAALKALEVAANDPTLFVLKPGSEVSIDVSNVRAAESVSAVEAAIKENLENAGFRVTPNANVQVVASATSAGNEDVTYYKTQSRLGPPLRSFARPDGPGETFSMPVYDLSIKIVAGGETAWSRSSKYKTAPAYLRTDDKPAGEAMASFRQKKPDAGFFVRNKFPSYVQRSANGLNALGISLVTAGGIQ